MSSYRRTVSPALNGGNVHAHHVTVCICTFKRTELLRALLAALVNQKTDGLFAYSVVVADNDPLRSAEEVVANLSAIGSLKVSYCVQPRQNIALTRNTALQHADQGDLIAFIDDDELPQNDWLYQLFKAREAHGVSGVLGPVKSSFQFDPPQWVKKGRFFERPAYATGYRLAWTESRTGNVLFSKKILNGVGAAFRPEFDTAGEDMDFFRRMMDKGHTFIWCEEAPVYEVVPPSRCKRRYLLKRALLRGSNFTKHPADRLRNLAKSLVAVPCYTMILPIVLVFGEHLFLRYLIKLLDHASRILAFLGLRLVTERAA